MSYLADLMSHLADHMSYFVDCMSYFADHFSNFSITRNADFKDISVSGCNSYISYSLGLEISEARLIGHCFRAEPVIATEKVRIN